MSSIVNQQFDRLMRKGAFDPIRRFIRAGDADDRVSEGVAQTLELALRKAARGELMDDALVVFAARRRALDIRRRFVKGGQPRRDAMCHANYVDNKVQVLHLDGLEDEDDGWRGEGDVGLQIAWAAALTEDPCERLDSALDLERWVETLRDDDRAVLGLRYSGCTLTETAAAVGSSTSATFAKLRRLGAELAARAGVSLRKKPRKARVRVLGHAAACPA
jgi:hypothetical protein